MKLMDFMDKIILRKRAIIETVNDVLKNTCQIEHFRHRSFDNFLTNIIYWTNRRLIFHLKNQPLQYLIKLSFRSNSS